LFVHHHHLHTNEVRTVTVCTNNNTWLLHKNSSSIELISSLHDAKISRECWTMQSCCHAKRHAQGSIGIGIGISIGIRIGIQRYRNGEEDAILTWAYR
jgi:hypothetical protein